MKKCSASLISEINNPNWQLDTYYRSQKELQSKRMENGECDEDTEK